MRINKIGFFLVSAVVLTPNLFAFGAEDIQKAGTNYVTNKVGDTLGSLALSNLNLGNLGLDGLNLDDINSLNLGTFMSAFSIQCDMPEVPRMPNNICDTLDTPDFQFDKTFDIGLCKVTANNGGTPNSFDSAKKMLEDLCGRAVNTSNSVSQTIGKNLSLSENFDMKTNVTTDSVTVNSEFLDTPTTLETVNTAMPNGLKESQIYDPKNGILGFDAIYKADKKIPNKLRNAFFSDDYATYKLYDRYAKTENQSILESDNGLKNFKPTIAKTYLEYKANTIANSKNILGSVATPYVVEKKLKRDLDKIKKEIGTDISGSSSIEMKANYLVLKDKIMTKLFTSKIESEWVTTESGKQIQVDKPEQAELAIALRDLENYELTKFGEEEDDYKRTHNVIVRPSQYKVDTKREEEKMAYVDKIYVQQRKEIRRRAEKMREIKNKQEMLKLLAKKVFISNLEYKSVIAEKEIEEILSK